MSNVVFLSGWLLSPQILAPIQNAFPGSHLLSLPERSAVRSWSTAVEKLADSIPEQSVVIAWSLGGLLALQMSAYFSPKIKQLILLATTPHFLTQEKWAGINEAEKKLFLQLFNTNPAALAKHFCELVQYPNKNRSIRTALKEHLLLLDHSKASWQYYLHDLMELDLRETYKQLRIPTLHLLGEKDSIVKTPALTLQNLNPQIKIETLQGAGHAFFLSHTDYVLQALRAFIQ